MMVPRALYWTLWMLACFGHYLGQELQFPELTNRTVGGSVMFTPNNPPSTTLDTISWQFGEIIILTGSPDSPSISSGYEDRVSFDRNTLALGLQNLRLDDSGRYRLTSGDSLLGETSLQVFETILYVNLTGPEEALIEGESSVNITSEGSGTISSVQWMKDNSPLFSSNSITFSSDNRSVSISPVQRSDSGEYQCTYSNPVSSETAKLTLTINYGPDDVSIKGPGVVDLGIQMFLSCSANSEPSASFSWMFNGSDTGVTTDKYTIDKADFTDSGDYICTAFNRVTNKRESQTHALLVQEGGGGLSAGAIAGIVIGVLVAVGGICGLIVYLTQSNKIPKLNRKQKGQASGAAAKIPKETEANSKTKGGKAALGKSSESDMYVNVSFEEDEYANVKPNRPKAPQPKVKK